MLHIRFCSTRECIRYSRVLLGAIRGPIQSQRCITMPGNKPNLKRKKESPSSADGKQPKLARVKAGKRDREPGWLEAEVVQLRREAQGCEFNKKRLRYLSDCQKIKQGSDGVLYWMFRDQRMQDNWALIYAQQLALTEKLPLHVCFCLVPRYMDAAYRQYAFMLKGLREVAKECKGLDIQFHLLSGEPGQNLPTFVKEWNFGAVVTDFNPLKISLQLNETVKQDLPSDIPFIQVDAHNVVPCWEASGKLEYGARTIRGKITKLLPEFLTEIPPVDTHPHTASRAAKPIDWEKVLSSLEVDRSVGEVDWAHPGTSGGMAMLESFIDQRLRLFATHRNNPNSDAVSNLSPWIHTGQLSSQRIVMQVKQEKSFSESVASFTEELVVRRELADNFCFYNPNYDNISGAYEWAKKTLQDHAKDRRTYIYTKEQLENSETHEQLWNAAQRQLVLEGKMHGFLRMYWAKKILEWTASPEEALSIALYFNDHYSLDGCDPNGFVGCMWSICGIHDQGWAERPIFGKIRYMNYAGCKRKFDVPQFEKKYAATETSKKHGTSL
ncbi:CPD photolyase isoform X1 [Triplophysa rosa]|uniref:Deoxyribodipyrimidine photo-lyase n=2 Tax=Triplophysa rosa TaxID=992332 RepID=A0A9W7WW14_TRIRA|nr:CPD photolyase isoform X1 [Triplophysa rosa]XP_057189096.1 CPD photolyase isoform X1 [Triplophysa rosa]XP_057189097.1 CPD photolyase isoform X1 [Triplophysa rosa]KAI7809299.1 Deoxyribodipyrimidine photo-lyase [Triplophysa rosa]